MIKNKKIIITGANGVIGQILQKGLADYQIIPVDLPKGDLRIYKTISNIAAGCSTIIHLAWDTKNDNFQTGVFNEENSRLFFNVYQAALQHSVPRVIVASSVHADGFYNWKGPGLMSPNRIPNPVSFYGAHKVFMETMGRYFATKGLEVVCIRFGGVNSGNEVNSDHLPERAAFFSRADCLSLIIAVLQADKVPDNFTIMYGVSNNDQRIHDLTNPFNWFPQEKAEDYIRSE